MDELVIDNLVYIPSKKAAAITGYAKDYVGQLCREGRIEAKLVGRSWYVLESSVREHRFGKPNSEPSRAIENAPEEASSPEATVEVPATPEPLPEEVWESPTYTAEPVPEVFIDSPTYLTNTTDSSAPVSQIEEVQNAWQEWFSKNEASVASAEEPVSEQPEETKSEIYETEEARAVEEKIESEAVEIPVIRKHISQTNARPIEYYERPQEMIHHSRPRNVERTSPMLKKRAKKNSGIAMRAVFVGVIILTIAVTVIGTGSLEAINPSLSKGSAFVEYLAGVKSIEK